LRVARFMLRCGMNQEIIDILNQTVLFSNLNIDDVKALAEISTLKKYAQDSIVFFENDTPTAFLIVVKGQVKVYKTDLKFNEVLLHKFRPYQMIAEMPLFAGINYPSSAAFETEGTLLHIDFKRFKEQFFTNSEVAFSFVQSLSGKIKQLNHLINQNMVLDATARLAQYLYTNEENLHLMKQKDIANTLHIQAETLSRLLKKLIVMELIEKEGTHYKVVNHRGLEALYSLS